MRKLSVLLLIIGCLLTGCFGKAAEARLEKELKSEDPAVRIKAATKLADVATPEAVRLLLLHKDDPDFRVKEAVKKALSKIDRRTFLN